MRNVWIYVISCVCVADCLTVCQASVLSVCLVSLNLNVGQYAQTFQPNSFILCMLMGTVDLYYFVPLSVALKLAEAHKVSRK